MPDQAAQIPRRMELRNPSAEVIAKAVVYFGAAPNRLRVDKGVGRIEGPIRRPIKAYPERPRVARRLVGELDAVSGLQLRRLHVNVRAGRRFDGQPLDGGVADQNSPGAREPEVCQ